MRVVRSGTNQLRGTALGAFAGAGHLGSPNFDRVTTTVSPRILRLGVRISY